MSDLWGVGLMGCRTYGVSDLWGVGVMGCRSYGVSDLWGVGLMGCRTYDIDPVMVRVNYLYKRFHESFLNLQTFSLKYITILNVL